MYEMSLLIVYISADHDSLPEPKFQSTISIMEHKKYWQSLGELKQTEAYEKGLEDEFAEDLPVKEDDKAFRRKDAKEGLSEISWFQHCRCHGCCKL